MEIYETLWRKAVTAFTLDRPQLDPYLPDRVNDQRRGVTFSLRPSPTVREKIQGFLAELAAVCPDQYFYPPASFHLTVLSIISGTENWQERLPQLAAYRQIVQEVLSNQPSFKINFHGITASPECVMIQGFPVDDHLEHLRHRLREAFSQNGCGGQLDQRYKITSAHITVMRFCHPKIDGRKLLAFLHEQRVRDFGAMTATELELVFSDWYASPENSEKLEQYNLIDRK